MFNIIGTYPDEKEKKLFLELIRATKKHSNGSRQYKKLFNKILLVVQYSCKLYQAKNMLQDKDLSEYVF